MCVDIATERPARSSCARRSIDSRRCWGTLRRSSTAFRAGQLRVRSAVEEVDHEPDDHPVDKPLPRRLRQAGHHVAADEDAENRHERHQWGPERTRQIRRLVAQHDDARANDDECEQRSDRHELTQEADREESRDDRRDYAGENRGDIRSLEAGMDLSEDWREEPVTRHRVEDARLTHEHHEHYRCEPRASAGPAFSMATNTGCGTLRSV